MRRILVIGNGGSGKSTLADRLAERLSLPVVHLDHLLWKPGWVQAPRADFERCLRAELEKQRWVMDGNYLRTLPERVRHADTVVFLDTPWAVCIFRILKRWLLRQGEQAPGCPQKVDWEFFKYVAWDFPMWTRTRIFECAKGERGRVNWVTLSGRTEIENFVAGAEEDDGTVTIPPS